MKGRYLFWRGYLIKRVHSDYTLFFVFIRTSNFGAEAERSYIVLPFEAENVLKVHSIHYMYFSKSPDATGNLSKCIAC